MIQFASSVVLYGLIALNSVWCNEIVEDFNTLKIEVVDHQCADKEWSDQVNLLLYTKKTQHDPILITPENVQHIDFNDNTTTTVIIHGYLGVPDELHRLRDKYLEKTDNNIIFVDWSSLAIGFYGSIVKNVGQVGTCIGRGLLHLFNSSKLSMDKVHIIGHSAGAHVSGFVGRTIKAAVAQPVGRITALDAAGPRFGLMHSEDSLSVDDAKFVDAIHTNVLIFGIFLSFGHADFYPNGGGTQPACENGLLKWKCSHMIAVDYYIESLESDQFVARKCGTYPEYNHGDCIDGEVQIMGVGTSPEARGSYFLETNAKPPYARGNQSN